jgi:hypothetical protein
MVVSGGFNVSLSPSNPKSNDVVVPVYAGRLKSIPSSAGTEAPLSLGNHTLLTPMHWHIYIGV